MDCLAAAGRWDDLTAAADGLRALLPVTELAPVVAWKAVALAHGQHRVLEGMTRLQADFNAPDIKVGSGCACVTWVDVITAGHTIEHAIADWEVVLCIQF
jgi:hypothetical protein